MRGCRPRVDGLHKATTIAQFEVAEGKVKQLFTAAADASETAARSEAVLEAAAVIGAV
jgi:hypothetical protein